MTLLDSEERFLKLIKPCINLSVELYHVKKEISELQEEVNQLPKDDKKINKKTRKITSKTEYLEETLIPNFQEKLIKLLEENYNFCETYNSYPVSRELKKLKKKHRKAFLANNSYERLSSEEKPKKLAEFENYYKNTVIRDHLEAQCENSLSTPDDLSSKSKTLSSNRSHRTKKKSRRSKKGKPTKNVKI